MHLSRQRRHGVFGNSVSTVRANGAGCFTKQGWRVRDPLHPLADKTGYVTKARTILYSGENKTNCDVCQKALWWKTKTRKNRVHVIYVDGNKADCGVANLKKLCGSCIQHFYRGKSSLGILSKVLVLNEFLPESVIFSADRCPVATCRNLKIKYKTRTAKYCAGHHTRYRRYGNLFEHIPIPAKPRQLEQELEKLKHDSSIGSN